MSENNTGCNNTENGTGAVSPFGVAAAMLIVMGFLAAVALAFLPNGSSIARALWYGDAKTTTTTASANVGIEDTTKESAYQQELIDLGFSDPKEHPASTKEAPVWEVKNTQGGDRATILLVRSIDNDPNFTVAWINNPSLEEDIKTARDFCVSQNVQFLGWCSNRTVPSFKFHADDDSAFPLDWKNLCAVGYGNYQVMKGRGPGGWGSINDVIFSTLDTLCVIHYL